MSITAKQAKKLQLETNDKEELTTGKIRKLSRMSRLIFTLCIFL